MDFPNMIKHPSLYAGQMGVPNSVSPYGLRFAPTDVNSYHVAKNSPFASDNNDGTDPRSPFLTISAGVAAAGENGDQIFVWPGSYEESVVTPDYDTGPNYVNIIGINVGNMSVQWSSGAATDPCLDMRAVGWTVENIKFLAPTTDACIVLRHTDTGANDIAINTVIKNCHFYGQTTGLYGIESHGCYLVTIEDCIFENFHNVGGTATAIVTTTTPLAIPYRNIIRRCTFMENDLHIDFACNGSKIVDNDFLPGYTYTATVNVRTSQGGNPGDDNLVTRNYFPLDYSIAGGYIAGAADEWVGNLASDVAEAEVDASGVTVARPA